MIAILVAVRQELKPILRRADANHVVRQEHLDFHEGTLGGQPVALLALGIGKECARIAAEMTIHCYRPDLVISSGFGGGLQSDMHAGDIVVGTEILELRKDQGTSIMWDSTHKPIHPGRIHGEDTPGLRVHYGKLLTTDEMVLRAENKARIGKATGALSVDMETSAVAAVCAARKTDFLAVRCITDKVERESARRVQRLLRARPVARQADNFQLRPRPARTRRSRPARLSREILRRQARPFPPGRRRAATPSSPCTQRVAKVNSYCQTGCGSAASHFASMSRSAFATGELTSSRSINVSVFTVHAFAISVVSIATFAVRMCNSWHFGQLCN